MAGLWPITVDELIVLLQEQVEQGHGACTVHVGPAPEDGEGNLPQMADSVTFEEHKYGVVRIAPVPPDFLKVPAPRIDRFDGRHYFLGNFFWVDGTTLEHQFQADKTFDPVVRAWVLSAPSPHEARKRGKSARMRRVMRPDWDDVRDDVMLKWLRWKFEREPLGRLLVATYPAELVEGNTWNDTYWGVYQGAGVNRLGTLLMQVRDELREQQ